MADRTVAVAFAPAGALVGIHVSANPDRWIDHPDDNGDGYVTFQIDDSLGDTDIRIVANGYQPYQVHYKLPSSHDVPVPPRPMNHQINVGSSIPALTPKALPRIWASGWGLVTDFNAPFLWAGADSFRLQERVVLGEPVDQHLDQLRDCGVKVVRILADAEWFRFKSWQVPHYYDMLGVTFDKLAQRSMYAQFCVFADWQQVWGGDKGRADQHFALCVNVMRQHSNTIGQLVNEGDEHGQNFPFDGFPLPDDILFSSGSTGTGNNPPHPLGRTRSRYNSFGCERNTSRYALNTTTIWFAVNGYAGEGNNPGWEGTRWDTVCDEPPNMGQDYGYGPDIAYLLGQGCRWDENNRAAGGNAHFTAGKQSVVANSFDEACLRAFIKGVKREG